MALANYSNEYGKLKRVALYKPCLSEIYQGNPGDVMYTDKPDPKKVLAEFNNVVQAFQSLGVEVIVLQDQDLRYPQTTNMIFLRDVAAVIGDKIILANMKFDVRKDEPSKFRNLLIDQKIVDESSFMELSSSTTMEGADIFVTSPSHILTYIGYRTSVSAVIEIVKRHDVKTTSIPANIQKIPQHLLGALHIIGPNVMGRRPKYSNTKIDEYKFIDFDETHEINEGFAMNIVTIAPMEILMPSGCQKTKDIFERNGVKCHV
jgi:N-dimethylarginine dimethylaminohydrolase